MRARTLAYGAAAAALALAAFAARAAAPETVHWEVDAERGYSADIVQFTLSSESNGHRSMTSSPASLNTFQGLTADQLRAPTSRPVAFKMQRDAGEFDCQGVAWVGEE